MPKLHTPTNDLLFKRSLANAKHPDVTAGFINDMLGLDVAEIHIENPYDIQVLRDALGTGSLKPTIVDVRVRLSDKSQVLTEMQVEKQTVYLERGLYYIATRFITDYDHPELQPGESKYSSLNAIYGIHVLDFIQFDQDRDALRNFALYDILHQEFYGNKVISDSVGGMFNLTFLELGKDRDTVAQNVRYWMDFFKGRALPEDVPDYIRTALELSEECNLSEEEAHMISAQEMAEQDRIGQLAYARGEGREQGQREGRQAGQREGRQQGQRETALSVARSLLKTGMDIKSVALHTNLDLDSIRRLKATGPCN
jgi:predicted transposase/invertase (TIGR01784 family)